MENFLTAITLALNWLEDNWVRVLFVIIILIVFKGLIFG
jgi:hypothetical protein